jgi:hypothetical protein
MTSRSRKLLPALVAIVAFTLFLSPPSARLIAQSPTAVSSKPDVAGQALLFDRGAAALWQSLQKLHTRGSVLMVTAHPDDEDGGMLATSPADKAPGSLC